MSTALPELSTPTRRSALQLRHVAPQDWDGYLARMDFVCQEQLYAYARLRYGGLTAESVVFERDGEVVGGSLVLVRRLPLNLGGIAVTKWGPVLADEAAPDAALVYRQMVEALKAEFAERRNMLLSVMARPAVNQDEFDQLLALGFRPGAQLRAPERYFVDVRHDDAGLRAGFAQKWRNRLNKAEASGLVFERATAEQEPEFAALFRTMLERKQYVDHSAYETIPALLNHPIPALRYELFFARHEGRAVAGAVVVKAGRTATYLYGASDDAALPLSAGHFMQYNIIRWLRDNTRTKWYNLGGHDDNEGLRTFKTGLVGKTGAVMAFAPSAQIATHIVPRVLGQAALMARQTVINAKRGLEGWRSRPKKAAR